MGKWIHRISQLSLDRKTATCVACGPIRPGKHQHRWRCPNVIKGYRAKAKQRLAIPLVCNRCKFKAVDRCQIDRHHIDGVHSNDSVENIEFVCANCHRLISKLQSIERKKAAD